MKNWFEGCLNLDEIRKRYHDLAKKFHPDLGGDTATMQDINKSYTESARESVRKDDKFDWKKHYPSRAAWWYASDEMNEKIRQVLEQLVKLPDLVIEVCGTWIWVGGDTKPVKDTLKSYGLKWSHDKEKWYWVGYKSHAYRRYSMEEIRSLHGSTLYKSEEKEKPYALPA